MRLRYYNAVISNSTIINNNSDWIQLQLMEKYCIGNFSPVKTVDWWHVKNKGCFEISIYLDSI